MEDSRLQLSGMTLFFMIYFVYILTNRTNNALYIGTTSNLIQRVYQHKEHFIKQSHTAKYNETKLVYYETFTTMLSAITREKQLKKWNHSWKRHLITKFNPHWTDLYTQLI